jgi:probable F420-dependent oxidoreductase
MSVKVGVPLFLLRPERIVDVARRAEELGFESVWMPEHLVFPVRIVSRYPYTQDGVPPIRVDMPLLDPLIVLAQIAAVTRRIRLGTNVYVLPLRHPLSTARLAVSVDVLSGGRLTLGIGAGWLEEEFQAVGVDFARRGAITRECVRALKALWTEPEPRFQGKTFAFGPLRFEPKPVQKPHLPIVFGGESDAALKRAAALGDGWYGVGHTAESAAAQVRKLRLQLRDAGREGQPFEITVSAGAQALDRTALERFTEAGVHRVVVLPWTRGRDADEQLARFAEAVL